MSNQEHDTEARIYEAARRVFVRKGMQGARMQEIADEANINKALLHYYFRSKQKLFDAVFKDVFRRFFPKVQDLWLSDIPFFDKIEAFIDNYLHVLNENPFLPSFILHETSQNPERISGMVKEIGINPMPLLAEIQKEVEKGTIRPIDPRHFIVNLLGLCLFAFVGKPLLQAVMFHDNSDEYNIFLDQRAQKIKTFVVNSIKKDQ